MNKNKLIMLIVMMFLTLSCLTLSTIAILTKSSSIDNTFQIDEIDGLINLSINDSSYQINANDSNVSVSITGLTYLDLLKDMPVYNDDNIIAPNASLINYLGTSCTITLLNKSNINVRSHINYTDIEGLIVLLVPSDENDYYQVLSNILENTSYNYIDIRSDINSYNYNFLRNLYENDDNILSNNKKLSFKMVFYGDYYGLSSINQETYLDQVFNLNINARLVQEIEALGGTCDYDND